METPKPPHAASKMTFISKSVAIKGEVSCDADLYIDGQVEGTIDPKGYRLTIGPNGRVKANITACAVVVLGKLEGNSASLLRSKPRIRHERCKTGWRRSGKSPWGAKSR